MTRFQKMAFIWIALFGVIAPLASPTAQAQDVETPSEEAEINVPEDAELPEGEAATKPQQDATEEGATATAPSNGQTNPLLTTTVAPQETNDPLHQLKRIATGQFWLLLMRFTIAIALLGLAAILGRIGQGLTQRFLTRTRLVQRFAELFSLEFLLQSNNRKDPTEKTIGRMVYYLVLAASIVLALQVVGFDLTPFEEIIDKVQGTAWKGLTAVIWLLLAFAGGRTLQGVTTRIFDSFNIDRRIRELSKTPPPSNTWAARILDEDENFDHEHMFSENAGKVAFWLIMLLGLALAFEALEIGSIAEPLTSSMNRIIGMLPSLALGGVLIFGGYLLGRLTSAIAHNLLHTAGFDGIIARLRLQTLFGANQPSYIVGVLIHIFVVLQAIIAALEELGLTTLSQPLTEMMARFWILLPDLGVATLIALIGLTAGRLFRGFVVSTLEAWGFDQRLRSFGFNKLGGRDGLKEPSAALGLIAQTAILLIAVAQAFEHLGLDLWARYVNELLEYGLTHVLVAALVAALGYGLANYIETAVKARAEHPNDPNIWLGTLAKYAILVFSFTAALRHLEIAEDFVLIAFGLVFGSLCLAMALAFGLGSREVAGDIVRKQYERALLSPPPTSSGPGGPSRPPGHRAAAYAKQAAAKATGAPASSRGQPTRGQAPAPSPGRKESATARPAARAAQRPAPAKAKATAPRTGGPEQRPTQPPARVGPQATKAKAPPAGPAQRPAAAPGQGSRGPGAQQPKSTGAPPRRAPPKPRKK
jgi:hypothetical protein